MERDEITSLLMKKPGYEIVNQLLDGPKRRKDLRIATNTEGASLQNWLSDAVDCGLIERDVFLRDEEKYVEYKLGVEIPESLHEEIKYRGRKPRATNYQYADSAAASHFIDDYPYR